MLGICEPVGRFPEVQWMCMDLWGEIVENIFLMCRNGKCVECRIGDGQMVMNLQVPLSAEVYFGKLNQVQMEAARQLLQDSVWLCTIEKMMNGPGADGVTLETRELYNLALAIKANKFRYSQDGWEVVT